MSAALRGLAVGLLFLGATRAAEAQLLSPGPLARAHESVEGLQNCTECHQLGKRGVAADRCLECHTPLAARLESDSGYHATVPEDACAECHQDHLGRDFELVRLDTTTFDHRDTGYRLDGRHGAVECRSCHEPARIVDEEVRLRKAQSGGLERTFLGLGRQCTDCHTEEDPHGQTFGTAGCSDCHDAGDWDQPLPFDHDGTDFPLVGEHREAVCAECHAGGGPVGAPGPPGGATLVGRDCADCHETPHGTVMASTCGDCHQPAGWHQLRAGALSADFDHTRTGFVLRGAHAQATCASCHRAGEPPRSDRLHMSYRVGSSEASYPIPESSSCASCHVNRHVPPPGGGRWLGCDACHAEVAWAPSSYGIAEHTRAGAFPLDGAHMAVPCVSCHVDPDDAQRFPLALEAAGCVVCHEVDERHRVSYADQPCFACHVTVDFAEVDFGHPPESQVDCATCHADEDPHDGQFGDRRCADCHGVEAFAIPGFDHSTTRFALDGAHVSVSCGACHTPSATDGAVRYRPLGTSCEDCHGGDA